MPFGDGWNFAEELRQRRLEIPIVMMTGVAEGSARRSAWLIDPAAYLPKPFDVDELYSLAERFGERPRAGDAVAD